MRTDLKLSTSSFTINKFRLLKELKNIAKVLGKIISERNKNTILELTITDNKLLLVIPGAKFFFDCETRNTAKVAVNFYHFLEIIKTQKDTIVTCVITDNRMDVNNIGIIVKTTFFKKNDNILRSIDLPLNYSDVGILKLEFDTYYTEEEIDFNNINKKAYLAKKTLDSNIKKVIHILKIYGIEEKDILEIINKKNNLDIKETDVLDGQPIKI